MNRSEFSDLLDRGQKEPQAFGILPSCIFFAPEDFNYISEWSEDFADQHMNPEEMVMRRELLSKLSEDAKEIIRLIIFTPQDIMEELVSSKTGEILRGKLISYLRHSLSRRFSLLRHGNTFRKAFPQPDEVINRSFEEIREYLREDGLVRMSVKPNDFRRKGHYLDLQRTFFPEIK